MSKSVEKEQTKARGKILRYGDTPLKDWSIAAAVLLEHAGLLASSDK
jgi:hypothetical protein